jgi:hypothetical protein
MPWVTFGYARAAGIAVTVRANMKDENYFAPAAGWTTRSGAASGAFEGRIGEKGRLARLFHEPKGSYLPLGIRRDGCRADYCFLPVKVPSPNCPSDTLPLIVFPSVLPEYFTARV